MNLKLDVLAFAAHPDDVEISAGATVAGMVRRGKKVGIVDLTRGELGSRGSADLRDHEAAAAARILGIAVRENLKLADGFFAIDELSKRAVVTMIRRYQPDLVLANSLTDRHPDHGRAAQLVSEASFLAGLPKVQTFDHGVEQAAWRPQAVFHYIQDFLLEPDVVVDVSADFETKMKAIAAFSSQFFDPQSQEPQTPISGPEFFDFLRARAQQLGRPIGALYGEGFNVTRYLGTDDLFNLR